MAFIRILLLAFNVAIFTYLIYRILQLYRTPVTYKGWKIGIAILLLLLPIVMIVGIIKVSLLYLLLYPVAISLHLYLIRNS